MPITESIEVEEVYRDDESMTPELLEEIYGPTPAELDAIAKQAAEQAAVIRARKELAENEPVKVSDRHAKFLRDLQASRKRFEARNTAQQKHRLIARTQKRFSYRELFPVKTLTPGNRTEWYNRARYMSYTF